MVPYLVGVVGALLGAVIALWWGYKLARAEGQIGALKRDVESLSKDKRILAEQVEAGLRREARAVEMCKEEVARRDRELEVYRATEERLRELLRKYSDKPELVAERLGMLFPNANRDG